MNLYNTGKANDSKAVATSAKSMLTEEYERTLAIGKELKSSQSDICRNLAKVYEHEFTDVHLSTIKIALNRQWKDKASPTPSALFSAYYKLFESMVRSFIGYFDVPAPVITLDMVSKMKTKLDDACSELLSNHYSGHEYNTLETKYRLQSEFKFLLTEMEKVFAPAAQAKSAPQTAAALGSSMIAVTNPNASAAATAAEPVTVLFKGAPTLSGQ